MPTRYPSGSTPPMTASGQNRKGSSRTNEVRFRGGSGRRPFMSTHYMQIDTRPVRVQFCPSSLR
jgi:hypothetical protein